MIRRHYIATLALTLATLGASGAAQAQFYNAATQYNSDPRAIRSAQAPGVAPLDRATEQALQQQFATGRNDAFGAATAPQLGQPTAVAGETSRIATTARPLAHDLLGTGGPQDELARRIYTPGGYTPGF